MGYYTDFTLTVEGATPDDLVDTLNEVTGYVWEDDLALYSAKWYDWAEDISKISLKYPDRMLSLEGSGEEKGDMWKAYIKNGKMQVCNAIVTFEPFDESKMK